MLAQFRFMGLLCLPHVRADIVDIGINMELSVVDGSDVK